MNLSARMPEMDQPHHPGAEASSLIGFIGPQWWMLAAVVIGTFVGALVAGRIPVPAARMAVLVVAALGGASLPPSRACRPAGHRPRRGTTARGRQPHRDEERPRPSGRGRSPGDRRGRDGPGAG